MPMRWPRAEYDRRLKEYCHRRHGPQHTPHWLRALAAQHRPARSPTSPTRSAQQTLLSFSLSLRPSPSFLSSSSSVMGLIRPATPGFLVTLIATGLLAVVSFNVPILKSIFFLKATITIDSTEGSIILGTLGYCLNLPNNQTCSKPSVGYELGQFALQRATVPCSRISCT